MKGTAITGALLTLLTIAWPGKAAGQEEKKTYPRNVITREEIKERAPEAKNAYEVVQRLRPQFLRIRPSGSMQNPAPVAIKVYVDGSFRGGLFVLRELISVGIIDITYFNGGDATTRFGTGHENGAIAVRTGA